MAISFPTSLDTLTNPTSTDPLNSPSHSGQHSDENDAVEALEAKVGVNSSAVATSLDYLLKNTSSSDPGHKHTLANGATDVTSSATEVNITDAGNTTEKVLNVQAKARAERATTAQTITSGSWQKVQLNSEVYDIGGDYDPATNYRFVAPVSGYYMITGGVRMDDIGADKTMTCGIYVNNALAIPGQPALCLASGTFFSIVSSLYYVVSGQNVELWVYHDAGTDKTVVANYSSHMSVHLLSV